MEACPEELILNESNMPFGPGFIKIVEILKDPGLDGSPKSVVSTVDD
jgi:hypothetical protein